MNKQFVEQSHANPQRHPHDHCAGFGALIESGSQEIISGNSELFVGITQQLAHDIRNVLGCVNGFVTLLQRDLEQNPESMHLLQKIRKGNGRFEQIADDLSLFSPIKPFYLTETGIDKAQEQAIQFCRVNIKKYFREIEIRWTPIEREVRVFVNNELFSRLFYVAVVTLIKNLVNGNEITLNTRIQTTKSLVQMRLTAIGHSEKSGSYSVSNKLAQWQNQRPFNYVVICKILQMLNGRLEQVALHSKELCIGFSLPYVNDLLIT